MNLRLIPFWRLPLLLLGVFLCQSLSAQSQLDVSATDIDFGPITMGRTGGHKIKLTNTSGATPITVTALNLFGANPGDFAVFGEAVPFVVPAGGSVNLLVTFDPGSSDAKSAGLSIVNDGATGTQTVLFEGEGCTIGVNPDPDADTPSLEQGGQVVVEIESAQPPVGQSWTWNEFTNDTTISDPDTIINGPADTTFIPADTSIHEGTFYCAGLNYTVEGGGGVFGLLEYEVQINNPGVYQFKLLSKQGEIFPDTNTLCCKLGIDESCCEPATNEENDIWVRVPEPNASALAWQGNWPDPAPNVDLGNDWFKVYKGSLGWDDNTVAIEEDAHLVYFQFNEPNTYTIQLSVRSINFCIDKFLLYNPQMTFADVEDPDIPVSPPSLPCGDEARYFDGDEDGFGDDALRFFAAALPFGFVDNNLDCDDTSPLAAPNLTEVEDGIDNNCNGYIDEGFVNAVGPCVEQRFNAGYESGVPYTTLDGREFLADNTYLITENDKNTLPGLEVANTLDDELYQTVRTGSLASPIEYEIPVTNGAYTVILHFAEVYHGVITDPDEVFPGRRVFDVLIEGDTVLNDYDIFVDAGAQATATTQAVTGVVNDGLMNLVFSPEFDGPMINAFEIIPQSGCGDESPFPVEWLSFDGIRLPSTISLSWSTGAELNNSHFIVERSTDARIFESIGEVASKQDPNGGNTYTFVDQRPYQQKSYYRLKQIDLDGKYSYSPMVEILEDLSAVKLYPNPLKIGEELNLFIGSKIGAEIKIELFNPMGQVISRTAFVAKSNAVEHALDISNLNPGYYIISVQNENVKETKKLMIVE